MDTAIKVLLCQIHGKSGNDLKVFSLYYAYFIMANQYINVNTLFLREPDYTLTVSHEVWFLSSYCDELEIILNLHGAQIPCHGPWLV